MIQSKARKGGFTLIELLVVVSIIGLLIGILLPALSRAKKQAQQIKDSAQIREIHRGLVTFAQNNRDRYPVPAVYDKLNNTEGDGTVGMPSQGAAIGADQQRKNRTGAIMSILIYNGTVTTEQCVSPAEAEGAIRKDPDFQFGNINQAHTPASALYDPGFVGSGAKTRDLFRPNTDIVGGVTPDNPQDGTVYVCNNSYAWQPHYGPRQNSQHWGTTYAANDPIMGNRGPVYIPGTGAQNSNATYPLKEGPEGTGSTTLLIHGPKKTWEGNLVYNDGHVQSENSPSPTNITLSTRASANAPELNVQDNVFFDEPWEGLGTAQTDGRDNVFMRQWPTGFNLNTANTNLDVAAAVDGRANDWISAG